MSPKKDDQSSMFKKIFSEARSKESEPLEEETAPEIVPPKVEPADTNEQRRPGRPRGRRSDPDYTKLCALIPMDLLLEVQSILLQQRRNRQEGRMKDMSALVEKLLIEWVEQNKQD